MNSKQRRKAGRLRKAVVLHMIKFLDEIVEDQPELAVKEVRDALVEAMIEITKERADSI